ncbi:MAG: carbohydrate kinase family protein [Patescibacteria group bacterium]|nr:carbohydrate kinase family protein [Patescibacteria group bacterium]
MLVITGTIAYDYIMDFPGKFAEHILPQQLHNINLSFIVNKFDKRRGGTAGNVSYTLGLLRTPNILFSSAGKDFIEYKKAFKKLKSVDISHVKIDLRNYTATGFAMTDKTDNQIWGYFYGAAESIAKLSLEGVVESEDLVLIGPSGAAGSMHIVKQCIKNRVPFMFDPGFILTQIDNEDLSFGVSYAHYVIGNDYEMNMLKERVKDWENISQEKIIITTLGEKGAEIRVGKKVYSIASVPPKNIIDPTGAGDAWRAGFLAGLNRNFDLQTCGQMGSVAASFAIEEYGTQEHRFSPQKFIQRYRQAFGSVIQL